MSEEKKNIRCSSLPRIMSCTASIENPDIVIDTSSQVTYEGNAIHEVLTEYAQGRVTGIDDINHICKKHGVEYEDISFLYYSGKSFIDSLFDTGYELIDAEAECRREFDTFTLTGHPDLRFRAPNGQLVIIDIKSGYLETNYADQLKGYGLLSEDLIEGDTFKIVQAFLRMNVNDIQEFTVSELKEFAEEISTSVKRKKKTYKPESKNCMYCPLARDCVARRSMLEASGRDMMAFSGEGQTEITKDTIGKLYSQSRMLKKALAEFEKQTKEFIKENGGICIDGKVLDIVESSRSNGVTFDKAFLLEHLTEEQINGLTLSVKSTELEKAISANADRGEKGKAIKAFNNKLDQKGLVKTSYFDKLEMRKG